MIKYWNDLYWLKIVILFSLTIIIAFIGWLFGLQKIFTFSEYIAAIISFLTIVLLTWYTIETQKYRKVTDSILMSQLEQNEISSRPWVYLGDVQFIYPNTVSFKILNSGKIPAQCKVIIEGLDLRDNQQNRLIELLEKKEITTTTVIPSEHIKQTDQKFSIVLNDATLALLLIHPQGMNIQFRMEYKSILSRSQEYMYKYLCTLKINTFDISKKDQDGEIVRWELQ